MKFRSSDSLELELKNKKHRQKLKITRERIQNDFLRSTMYSDEDQREKLIFLDQEDTPN
jgi:DNA repair protein RadC